MNNITTPVYTTLRVIKIITIINRINNPADIISKKILYMRQHKKSQNDMLGH